MALNQKVAAGVLSVSLLASVPFSVMANQGKDSTGISFSQEENTSGSLFNSESYNFVKYSEIKSQLEKIEKESNRITLEVKGKSAAGHDMFVVTISDPSASGKYSHFQALRKQMFKNPGKAQDWIDKNPDFKVPVMINASIHGTEYVGTDAALQLIERMAFKNDSETKSILENNIIIVNVVANPDGRFDGTRFNGNGIDLNRDFITQSQPETELAVELMTEWNPMVLLDLHGYVKGYGGAGKPGLIEPCTPPHNPNYEYDLFEKWALDQAEAMEAEIVSGSSSEFKGALYENMTGTYIPYRDDTAGWDDYPPIFTPMYAMYHGAYGHTLEAPTNDEDGVKWTYDAVMGALKFATENRTEMIKDQIEMFKRGIDFDHPTHDEGFFPESYILPVDQTDPTATEKAVEHLLKNDIEVEEVKQSFTAEGNEYPAGTYIVKMDQAKAGLANTMLWDGEDISEDTTAMYDISAWSLPELWGFEAVPVDKQLQAASVKVNKVNAQGGLKGKGPYAIPNSSVKAVKLVNELLQHNIEVYRGEAGNFYVNAQPGAQLKKLVAESGLTLETAKLPKEYKTVDDVKVAILKDGGMNKQQSHAGTKLALSRLGFDVTELSPQEVAEEGLGSYDVFVYSGTNALISTSGEQDRDGNKEFVLKDSAQFESFKSNVAGFVESGGKYISVGALSASATKTLGLTDVTVNRGASNSNGIVKVDYRDSFIADGYKKNDIGFVYRPAWFTGLNGQEVLASYGNSEDFFVAGFWRGESKLNAKGQPVIVKEQDKDVTLIGLEPGFRDHTDYLFRLLSNTIYQ
ncbi:M14 family zinc carboxypeptidase [Bacillus sp. SCS-153A]|uniref:M14 family zinc carboxypeptidase n=1 Tax=Rossellomorea sedimentorum TaxID=3115294 RepID=UPI0039063A3C